MSSSYTNLINNINNGYVESIILIPARRQVFVYYQDGSTELIPIFYNDQKLLRTAQDNNTPLTVRDIRGEEALAKFAGNVGLFLIFIIGITFLIRRSTKVLNNTFNIRELSTSTKSENNIPTRFDDVAGLREEKEELQEIVKFLKQPEKLIQLGAKIPKGVLLIGPPGTGKTLLAKAIAGEAQVPFFSISASEFVELFVGVGASRVRDLFMKAKAQSPCIVFIDEIDSIGRQRGSGIGFGNDEREQTLNQLLTEMDGFNDNSGVIVLAATNRPDVLDSALLRPGRFDRNIFISLPDRNGRKDILAVHSRPLPMSNDISLTEWSKRTIGFSGADLYNLLNESAIITARNNQKLITNKYIDEAFEKVTMGLSCKTLSDDYQKRVYAYQQVGRALVSLLISFPEKFDLVTIIPRVSQRCGFTRFTPSDDLEDGLLSRSYLISKLIVLLGSRAAEVIVYGNQELTQGSSNDLSEVAQLSREMVVRYGFSKLGPMNFESSNNDLLLGRSIMTSKNRFSQTTSRSIDKEVIMLAKHSLNKAISLIKDYRYEMDMIVDILIDEETITYEKFTSLLTLYKTTDKNMINDT